MKIDEYKKKKKKIFKEITDLMEGHISPAIVIPESVANKVSTYIKQIQKTYDLPEREIGRLFKRLYKYFKVEDIIVRIGFDRLVFFYEYYYDYHEEE